MHWREFAAWTIRVAQREIIVLLALLAVVVGIWAFVELADEVLEAERLTVDEQVLLAMRDQNNLDDPWGPQWLEQAAADITALGGVAVLVLAMGAVTGYLLLARAHTALVLVLTATLGGWIINSLLKMWIDRPRPDIVPHLTHVVTASFPSGHAMNAAVIYLTMAALISKLIDRWRLKVFLMAVAVCLTFLVGLSRVYLGVHYPSDVLAGWAAGLAWAAIAWLIVELWQRRHAVPRLSD